MSRTTERARMALIANDCHFPFQDDDCIRLFLETVKSRRPDEVVLAGDVADFYSISKFDKNPKRMEKANLKNELEAIKQFLGAIRHAVPKARITYIQGNHEQRLQAYIWRHAPALAWLPELEVKSLLGLKDLGIRYEEDGYWLGDLFCTHGTQLSQHAGESARKEFIKNGCSGISGHSHRDGKYSVRNRLGNFVWHENSSLCDLNPEYIQGVSNWSSGFSEVILTGKSPRIHFLPIIKGKLIYNGLQIK